MKYRYLYILILVFFTVSGLKAGNSKLDSLLNEYRTSRKDTARISAMLEIAEMAYDEHPDSAKHLWEKAAEFCDKALKKDTLYPINQFYTHRLLYLKSMSEGGLGYIYFVTGEPDKGLSYQRIALQLLKASASKKDVAQAFNNIGYMYNERGDMYTAVRYYDSCLVLKREIKDTDGISMAINNLGYAYSLMDDTAKAMQYYKEALVLRTRIHDVRGLCSTLNNIATVKSKAGFN